MMLHILIWRNYSKKLLVTIKFYTLHSFKIRVDSLKSRYPWNETNITFIWLSSLYNPFNIFGTSSRRQKECLCVGCCCFFFKKESNVFLDFQIFLSNLPAIDVKHLLKWLAMMCSSDIVILSILRVSFWDTLLDVFV